MMAVVVGLTAIGLFQLQGRSGMRRYSGAAKVTLLSMMLFLLETISLHGVDALIYQPARGLLVIGWLWLLLGGMTAKQQPRSEEHTSELQSLMRISYAVFCLKK